MTVTIPNSITFSDSVTASEVISAGAINTGAVVSITVTSCSWLTVFPAASAAVHVIVVLPRPKN